MTNPKFHDAAKRFAPIKTQILEQLAKMKAKIKSDKEAPLWSPFGTDLGNAIYGKPVYQISGDRFLFCDLNTGYDIEEFVKGFNVEEYLTQLYKH